MGLLELLPVQLHAQAGPLRQIDAAVHDLQRCPGQALQPLLPDPVGVDAVELAGHRRGALGHHGQGDIEVVVGVAAPHQAEIIAHLAHPDGARHGPEVRVGQGDIHTAQGDAVAHLPPVGVNHVGGGGHAALLAELRHNFAAGEAALGAAGILAVGQNLLQLRGKGQRVLQQPAAVGVQGNAGLGEGLLQSLDGLQLLPALQHAALELEVFKAVLFIGGPGQRHNGVGGQRLLVAQAVPGAVGVGLGVVGQIGLFAVAHVEQIAQKANPVPLDAVAQQGGHGHLQILAQQVQQGSLHRGDHVHAGAQVKGLLAPHVVLNIGREPLVEPPQGHLVVGHAGALHQVLHVLQGAGDFLAAGDLANAGIAPVVSEHHNVAGEIGGVGAGEVELHTVLAGHGIDLHGGHFGGIGHYNALLCSNSGELADTPR